MYKLDQIAAFLNKNGLIPWTGLLLSHARMYTYTHICVCRYKREQIAAFLNKNGLIPWTGLLHSNSRICVCMYV